MDIRSLGAHGLTVSAIGYGSMGTAIGYGPSDDTSSITAIRKAYERGVTHFDTARMYGWGEGEKLLGTAVRPFRDDITIATKFGLADAWGTPDSRPETIREVVDTSLKNLGTDTIDLLYQHVPDPQVPIEEVVGIMNEFVVAGKVRYLGLSNSNEETLRRGATEAPLSAFQFEYSIFARDVEPILPALRELNIGLIAYSPLARGFLSGAVQPRSEYAEDDFRQRLAWWQPDNFAKNLALTRALSELAHEKGITLAQLSLAWVLAQGDDVVPIPGSRNADRVEENLAAADVELTAEDLARIREVSPTGGIGGRFSVRGTRGTPRTLATDGPRHDSRLTDE